MTAFKLTVSPSVEPVLLADAKTQARIDTTADDAFVTNLIIAARQWVEKYTGRALITQTWQFWLDMWPAGGEMWWDGVRDGPITGFDCINYLTLPRAPLQSVNSVQYFDNTDAATVWDPGNYYVDTIREPGRLALRLGSVWPAPSRPVNGIMVEYVAGYGNDGSAVPEVIKTALRQLVSHWYEHRGEAATAVTTRGTVMPALSSINVPMVIQALLDPYRIRSGGI